MTDNDVINHPAHYTAYKGIEVIQLTEQMNFCRGNAVKYIARAGLKSPDTEVEDLKKAEWYIRREIERLEKLKVESAEATEEHEHDWQQFDAEQGVYFACSVCGATRAMPMKPAETREHWWVDVGPDDRRGVYFVCSTCAESKVKA